MHNGLTLLPALTLPFRGNINAKPSTSKEMTQKDYKTLQNVSKHLEIPTRKLIEKAWLVPV